MFLSDRGVYLRSVDPASAPRYTKHDSPPSSLSLSFSSSPHDPSWQIAFTIRAYDRPFLFRFLSFRYSSISFFFFFVHDVQVVDLQFIEKVSRDLDIFNETLLEKLIKLQTNSSF